MSFVFITNAQNVACFTTSSIKGCVPFTVTIDPSCATNNSGTPPYYLYDYTHNTSNFDPSTIHKYTTAGTYTIRQIISTSNIFYDVVVEAVDPTPPIFSVTSCSGRSITAAITDPSYAKFIVDFGDGSPAQTVLDNSIVNHIYATEGSKSVTVTGVYNPNQSCKSITKSTYAINAVVKPDITDLKVVKQQPVNGSTQVRFNSITGQKYRIERATNGGAFSTIGSTLTGNNSIITYTDANLNTQGNEYQYRIVSFDDCGTEISSNDIATVRISATSTTNLLNNISWSTSSTVSTYLFTKNGTPQSLVSPTTTSLADNLVECKKKYCYQSVASLSTLTLAGTPQQSYSVDTCVVAEYIPATIVPVINVNSTMNGNNAFISWNSPIGGVSSTTIYQSINGGTYNSLATLTTNSYSYSVPNSSLSYCYEIDYVDLCKNHSPKSSSTCPVLINGTITGTTVALNWNTYSGFDGTGVQSYIVQKLDQSGSVISETIVGTNTSFSESVDLSNPYLNYRIKVIPTNTAYKPVFSNNSIFTFEAQIFVPDIFTPNGDGANELFEVKAKYVKTFSITIFSRWGEVVYASNSLNEGWNGSDKNVLAIEGAYTYKIVATDIHDKEFVQTGTVTLTR